MIRQDRIRKGKLLTDVHGRVAFWTRFYKTEDGSSDRRDSNLVSKRRSIRAIGIVVLMGVLILGIDRVGMIYAHDPESSTNENRTLLFSDMIEMRTDLVPEDILDRIERSAAIDIVASTAGFSEEIVIPCDAQQFRHDPSTSIFSFSLEGSSQSVLDQLTDLWSGCGWQAFPLGDLDGATFMKAEGEYQWMVITCMEIGKQVCVVGNPLRA